MQRPDYISEHLWVWILTILGERYWEHAFDVRFANRIPPSLYVDYKKAVDARRAS